MKPKLTINIKPINSFAIGSVMALALCLGVFSAPLSLAKPPAASDPQTAVDAAYAKFKNVTEGKNADYIPALAKVDPNLYGIAIITADGKVTTAGDVKTEVAIESIPKVFTLARVIQDQGPEHIEKILGVDATGMPFNSVTAIEYAEHVRGGPTLNPFVNPGAITTTSMVQGNTADEVWAKIIGTYNDFAGRPLSVMEDVYKSESDTNEHNRAIALLMQSYGYIKSDSNALQATDIYTRQCSVGVNARDLATMAATLANGGKNPVTGKRVMDEANVPEVLAVMATAGLYENSGEWLYDTGLPAKSGVGGGIIAVSPGKFGIAVVSPPLDKAGNSVRAQRAITAISNDLGGNPLAATAK